MRDDNLKEIKEEKSVENSNVDIKETKYVVERRKPSIFLSIILVLIGAVITAIIMLICFGDKIIAPKVEENNVNQEVTEPQQENPVKETRVLNLNPNGDFVKLLYSKLLIDVRRVPVGYSSNIVTYDSIEEGVKGLFALKEIKGKQVSFDSVKNKLDNKIPVIEEDIRRMGLITVISVKEADEKYKSLFGSDKAMPLMDIETGMGYVYEYVPEDDCFYGHIYAGGGGSSFTFDRKITSVEKNDEATEVYIYDCFACANYIKNVDGKNLWNFYGANDETNIIKEGVAEVFGQGGSTFDGKTMDESLAEIVDKGEYKYKHTFKLDDAGNYYWYSSEPVK